MLNCLYLISDLSAMMISGEYAVEVISPTGALSCTLPPLPFQQFGHTHNKNIICGGTNPLDDEGQFCYNLTSSGWKKSHTLLYGRTGHTSWDVDEGVMLLGGHGSRTTEIAKWDGSTVETFRLKYQTLYCPFMNSLTFISIYTYYCIYLHILS